MTKKSVKIIITVIAKKIWRYRDEFFEQTRDLLDAAGYYSELRSYTTNISGKDNMIKIPRDLKKVPENDNSLDDIFYEMTTVVQK